MATVETLTAKIVNKVQDESYTSDIILELMQQLHLELAEGIVVPGERRISPPLPDLFTIGAVYTSPSVAHVSMPEDYMRAFVFCANSSGREIRISDTFNEFAQNYPSLNNIRTIERVAVKGKELYYQGIEKTTLADAQVTVSFTSATKRIDDSGCCFLGLVAGETINVDGSTSNDGDKTTVTVATDGSYCTVAETIVTEAAGDEVTITKGAVLTVHYYRVPETMTGDSDTPEGIPLSLQLPLFEYGVSAKIYDEIEDGVEGQKVNTMYNEKRFNDAIMRLVKIIEDEGPSFFIGPDR